MLKTVAELQAEGVKRYRFPEDNEVGYWMDWGFWRGLPSDRIFYHRGEVQHERSNLVADGYGAKENYGNGSIYINHDQLPRPLKK